MTRQEFSDEFDVLLNSYAHTIQFGDQASYADVNIDEYEKSVFLTHAQEAIVKELYLGSYTGDSFESSEKLRRELQSIVQQKEYTSSETVSQSLEDKKYTHTVYSLPEELMYIVFEQVSWESSDKCISSLIADVYPTTHDAYLRIRKNPFKGPNNRRVLRLDKGNNQVELISTGVIGKYTIRYIKQPKPIILTDLSDSNVNIENLTYTDSACELPESLHKTILDRAVRMALMSKNINTKNNGE